MIGGVQVFGPAYLDRVVEVDRRLLDPDSGAPLDQSVNGRFGFGPTERLELVDPLGTTLRLDVPESWPGPWGVVELEEAVCAPPQGVRSFRVKEWRDDLGGMGAGFAAALGGTLISALGPESDPTSQAVSALLKKHGVSHQCQRVADHRADWTLLVSSGEHGDKLAVGFRGCHAAVSSSMLARALGASCALRVVAGLPNRLAAAALQAPGAGLRVFAPAFRNMIDRDPPILEMAGDVDMLCCNRREWEALDDREEVAARVSILVVTDGAQGSRTRYTNPQGEARMIREPAFPRGRPPRDTNRAGEAFAACLTARLTAEGWDAASGVIDDALMAAAVRLASAAAALVLDRADFGFPTEAELDRATALGRID